MRGDWPYSFKPTRRNVDFHIRKRDGTAITSWREVAGTYHDSNEAQWLWRAEAGNRGRRNWEPDAVMGEGARILVERKGKKYGELSRRRGQGYLLVLLHSPMTTRSTRTKADHSMLDLLGTATHREFVPFEFVWFGYHLPWTVPEEMEDPRLAFLDAPDADRFNFLKCIWNRPDARAHRWNEGVEWTRMVQDAGVYAIAS